MVKIPKIKPHIILRNRLSRLRITRNIPSLLTKVGKPPGTLVYTGVSTQPTEVSLITFDEETASEFKMCDLKTLKNNVGLQKVNWISVWGLQDTDMIAKIGEQFNIHPLTMEDILNVEHLPKYEEHEHNYFFTLKILRFNEETETVEAEHFSIVENNHSLITFQETPGDMFDSLRERILDNSSPARKKDNKFLTYRLIDTIVDHYYQIVNVIDVKLEQMEVNLVEAPQRNQIHDILHYKKQIIQFRRSVDPLKDALRKILNLDTNPRTKTEKMFINDVYDHLNHIISNLEVFRESLSNLSDLYMSIISNKMNTVMKTLTIIATIFIPLTFIAGIYGMNFEYMPELKWKYGYFTILGFMGMLGLVMFVFMKRRDWF